MKLKLTVGVILILLSTGVFLAQGPAPRAGNTDREAFAQRRIDRLAVVLSLTDSQKQQATNFFNTARQEGQPLREEMKQARSTLFDAVKSGDDAQIDQAAAKVGALAGQMAAVHAKAFARLYSILTPEQRQKAYQLEKTMMPGGFGFHPHPGM